jgi:non-ribosomal peptide synthase protein (TIGR01720 family)
LTIDAFSWRVLLEDLVVAYNHARAGRPTELPPRTSSIKTWIEATIGALQVQQLAEERAFWLAEGQPCVAWPCDFPRAVGDNLASATEVEIVQLNPEATERLLRGVTRTVRADVRAVLLGALTFVLLRWTGFGRMVIDVEGHGRTPLVDELDVSRTIGWFTATFPLSIEVPADAEAEAVVRAADAMMRSVPKGGGSFGFLAQAGGEGIVRALQGRGPSDVGFLYLGTMEDATPSLDAPRRVGVEQTVDPTMPRRWIFEITASVAGGELKIEWRYPGTLYRRETLQALARNLKECLSLLGRSELAMDGPAAQLLEDAAEFGLTPLDVDAIGAALSNAEGVR